MNAPTIPRPGSDFEITPEGTFPAVCYRIIDLGTQPQTYKGQPSEPKHVVMISWELHDEDTMMSDGRPMTAHRRFTWSMSPKANLRKTLEAWRGKPFQDSDFDTFDIRNLLGVGCLVQITHREREGNTYANVGAVVKMAKGMHTPEPKNALECLWLSPDLFDQELFDNLSEKMQETIKQAPEYEEIVSGGAGTKQQPSSAKDEDDTPF